jgi:hypothetical protein
VNFLSLALAITWSRVQGNWRPLPIALLEISHAIEFGEEKMLFPTSRQ